MLKPIKTRYYLTLLQMLVILFLLGLGILLNKDLVTQFFYTTQAGQLGLVLNGIILLIFLGGLVRMIMIFLGYTREQDTLQRFLKRAQRRRANPAYGLADFALIVEPLPCGANHCPPTGRSESRGAWLPPWLPGKLHS